jgi:hypothetical protein
MKLNAWRQLFAAAHCLFCDGGYVGKDEILYLIWRHFIKIYIVTYRVWDERSYFVGIWYQEILEF